MTLVNSNKKTTVGAIIPQPRLLTNILRIFFTILLNALLMRELKKIVLELKIMRELMIPQEDK